MNFIHVDSGHFGPSLIGISVVVQKFVAEHQCYRQQPIFASGLASNRWIEFFEPVYEEQCEYDHILSDQRG